ncbi:MAG: SMI1/KNR4 family protein [Janthinobacterium lividum]
MWYSKLEFFDKQPGLLDEVAPDFFSKPLTEEEINLYPGIGELHPQFIRNKNLFIPPEFTLLEEHHQLLTYSDGGGITNGEREFGYFSLQGIREYYFGYGFPEWAPYFLPIAFNGGGKFYAYDFRDAARVPVVAVGASALGYEDAVVLGQSLAEVLSKTTNIEDELDALYT